MKTKLSPSEVMWFCKNTIESFETQFQTIDPLDHKRAQLKLYALQQQLKSMNWDAKGLARQIAADPFNEQSVYQLRILERTLDVLTERLNNVETEIEEQRSRSEPKTQQYASVLYRVQLMNA